MNNCKFCTSKNLVKNGKPKNVQRYLCKDCLREQIEGDNRCIYSNEVKKAAVILYLEGVGFRGCARSLSKIFNTDISFQIVSHWINNAGSLVKSEIAKRKEEEISETKKELAVVELDELYAYIKKNLARIGKQENGKGIIPEYGLLLIGTQAICLNLK